MFDPFSLLPFFFIFPKRGEDPLSYPLICITIKKMNEQIKDERGKEGERKGRQKEGRKRKREEGKKKIIVFKHPHTYFS